MKRILQQNGAYLWVFDEKVEAKIEAEPEKPKEKKKKKEEPKTEEPNLEGF